MRMFDPREALGIVEKFAAGNFEELMDYGFDSWQTFSQVAKDYIPTCKHKKFLAEIEKVFWRRE